MNKKITLEAIKFTLFSISAGVIQAISFTLLNELTKSPEWLSSLIALILSVLWNFTFNRKFTFKAANNVTVAMAKVFGFYLVFAPVSTIAVDYFTGIGINEYIVQGSSMLANLILEFLFCKFVVYNEGE